MSFNNYNELINKNTMENILTDRDEEINSLLNFTEATKKELNEIVSNFGWNTESIEKAEATLTCPFDSSHRLYEKSVEKHIENCLWKAEGYSEDDLPLSIPSVPPDASTSIKLDEQLIEELLQQSNSSSTSKDTGYRLIPRTSDRLLSSFTPEERRRLYDYVVSNTEKLELGEDIEDINKTHKQGNDGKSFTYLELIAHERNLKRRRAKHRGVHTNKKSQTEIMREVINQQMEILTEYLGDKDQVDKVSSDSENSHQKSRKPVENTSNETSLKRNLPSDRESSKDYDYKRPAYDHRSRNHSNDEPNGHFSKNTRDKYKSDRSYRNDRDNSNNYRDKHRNDEERHSKRSRSPRHSESHDKYSNSHNFANYGEKYSDRRDERHSRHSRSPKRRESREMRGDSHSEDRRKHKKHHKHRSKDRDEESHKNHKSKSHRRSRERDDDADDYYHSKKHKKSKY